MAFKEVSTGGGSISSYWPKKASERKVGDSVVGKYYGKLNRPGLNGGDDTLYLLKDSQGGTIGVNQSATISRAMEQIPEGSMVKIVYNGKATGKNGRQYNDFKVYMDDGEGGDDGVDLENLDF